jgi:ketosteroid isomerase-like protein
MSRENVELVRRMLERYSADDVEGWIGCWDADGEWIAFGFEPVEGARRAYRGHEGLRRFRADVLEAFADPSIRAIDFRDAGDTVVVLGELSGRGAASGAAFEQSMAWLFELREGKLVRGRDYLDPRQALEAAGLPLK